MFIAGALLYNTCDAVASLFHINEHDCRVTQQKHIRRNHIRSHDTESEMEGVLEIHRCMGIEVGEFHDRQEKRDLAQSGYSDGKMNCADGTSELSNFAASYDHCI